MYRGLPDLAVASRRVLWVLECGRRGTRPAYRTLAHVLHPLVWNAPSLPLIVTVVGPSGFPFAMIAAKSPLVSFNRDQ